MTAKRAAASRSAPMAARPRAGGARLLAACSPSRLFGPLANLALWSVAERWYTPFKLPVSYGLRYWEVVFRPTGDAMASLVTSVWIALAHGRGRARSSRCRPATRWRG